jgi:hypothetical protein
VIVEMKAVFDVSHVTVSLALELMMSAQSCSFCFITKSFVKSFVWQYGISVNTMSTICVKLLLFD